MKCCQTCAQHTNKPVSKCKLSGANVGRKKLCCSTVDQPEGAYEPSVSALSRLSTTNRAVKEAHNG